MRALLALPLLAALAACGGQGGDGNSGGIGDASDTRTYSGIGADEALRFTGTEPFWGGEASGTRLTYSTPESQDGTTIPVQRRAGNNGLSLTGTLEGRRFDMAVSEAECSDGMSDRTYPFTVTLMIGEETRNGCGWTERRGFEGPERP